jgi:hypothetical protein
MLDAAPTTAMARAMDLSLENTTSGAEGQKRNQVQISLRQIVSQI